jgi:hypothetical protein
LTPAAAAAAAAAARPSGSRKAAAPGRHANYRDSSYFWYVLRDAWEPDRTQLPVNFDDRNKFIARVDDHAGWYAKMMIFDSRRGASRLFVLRQRANEPLGFDIRPCCQDLAKAHESGGFVHLR